MYAQQPLEGMQDLMRRVEELEANLDNSDAELVVAKAALWSALNLAPDAEAVRERLQAALDEGEFSDPQEVVVAGRLVGRLAKYVENLQELAARIVGIQKMRAQIQTATVDARIKQQLVQDVLDLRAVLEEHLAPDTYAAIYERIIRQLKRSRGVRVEDQHGEA